MPVNCGLQAISIYHVLRMIINSSIIGYYFDKFNFVQKTFLLIALLPTVLAYINITRWFCNDDSVNRTRLQHAFIAVFILDILLLLLTIVLPLWTLIMNGTEANLPVLKVNVFATFKNIFSWVALIVGLGAMTALSFYYWRVAKRYSSQDVYTI